MYMYVTPTCPFLKPKPSHRVASFPNFFHQPLVVLQEVTLREGTQAFGWWAKPPVTPVIRIYIYNVTNADEFLNNGSKPIVDELGPYVYT